MKLTVANGGELIVIHRGLFFTSITVCTGDGNAERKAISHAVSLLEDAANTTGRAGAAALAGTIARLRARL